MLVIKCCHCGTDHADDLELFDHGQHSMRCSACGQHFQFAIQECPACGYESVHVRAPQVDEAWPELHEPCPSCGHDERRLADVREL